uniref:Secreted protein n=1 Tax=Oncorhynchus mykiss TaxID=8022 RepID=A0A8K9X9V6_ONCMY
MVVGHLDVGALIVVVASVVGPPDHPRPLLGVGSSEIHLWVTEDLVVLEGRKLGHELLHGLLRGQGAALPTLGRGGGDTCPAHRGQPIGLCSQHCPFVAVLLKQLLDVDLLVVPHVHVVTHGVLIASNLEENRETEQDIRISNTDIEDSRYNPTTADRNTWSRF